MREALDRQLQEKAARDGALKQHESNCFPANHTASFQPADTLRVWSSHYATQQITAQEEARVSASACGLGWSLPADERPECGLLTSRGTAGQDQAGACGGRRRGKPADGVGARA